MNDKLEKIIKTIAQGENLTNYKTEVNDGSSKGDGYVGIIKAITITGRNSNQEVKTVNCIAKCASSNENLREKMPVQAVFRYEIFFYDTIFPTFRNFETTKGLTPTDYAPKFYGSVKDDKQEVLVMENLKTIGYKLHEHNSSMDENHVKLVLNTYGRYHAISFALRDQDEKKFNSMVENVPDILSDLLIPMMGKNLIGLCNKALAALDVQTESKAAKKFENFINNIHSFIEEIKVTIDDKYTVLLHGDCWTNNMMFKYGDQNELAKPTDVRLLDYQVVRLGYPVLDMVYFFYACSSLEIIKSLDFYKNFYYNSLAQHLLKLGSDPKEVYPVDVFEDQFKKFAKFALLFVPVVAQVASSDKSELIDFESTVSSGGDISDAFIYETSNPEFFNNRMRNLILHFVEQDLM